MARRNLSPWFQRVEHFVRGDGDRGRALHAAFDFDVAGFGQFAVHGGRIGGDVPAAFLGGDIHHAAAARFFGAADRVHGKLLDARAGFGVGGKGGAIRCGLTAQAAKQSSRNDQRTAEHDRRGGRDVAHGLEFLLAALQPGFEVVEGAPDVFEIKPHVLSGGFVVRELDEAVGPEIDFLGQPLVDGGERLVHMGDAASGDFAEVLGDKRGGREGEGALFLPGGKPGRCRAFRSAAGDRSAQAVRGPGAVPNRQRWRCHRAGRGRIAAAWR